MTSDALRPGLGEKRDVAEHDSIGSRGSDQAERLLQTPLPLQWRVTQSVRTGVHVLGDDKEIRIEMIDAIYCCLMQRSQADHSPLGARRLFGY